METKINIINHQIDDTMNSIKLQGIPLNRREVSHKFNNEIKSIINKKVSFNNKFDIK